MDCAYCNMHDQIIGRACTRCGRTVTYHSTNPADETTADDVWTGIALAAEGLSALDAATDPVQDYNDSPSVPDSSGFSGFEGGDTGGGGSFGDF